VNLADSPQLIGPSTRNWLRFNEGDLVWSPINLIQKCGHLDRLSLATNGLAILVVALCLCGCAIGRNRLKGPNRRVYPPISRFAFGRTVANQSLASLGRGRCVRYPYCEAGKRSTNCRERMIRRCSRFNTISRTRVITIDIEHKGHNYSTQTRRTVLNMRSEISLNFSSVRLFYGISRRLPEHHDRVCAPALFWRRGGW